MPQRGSCHGWNLITELRCQLSHLLSAEGCSAGASAVHRFHRAGSCATACDRACRWDGFRQPARIVAWPKLGRNPIA
jgi:hypothetical protein